MQKKIEATLQTIEKELNVTILFAVESGSRAWGFASPNSDYDVRFVYARSARQYLSVCPPRDVIELPIVNDLDVNGWDMRKALTLFRASNPPLLEWLQSPIIYRQSGPFLADLQALARQHFSPKRVTYHYLSMLRRTFADHIAGRDEVISKKYLYALRPLVCIRWLERHGTFPPTEFSAACARADLPPEIAARIEELLKHKRAGDEMGCTPADPLLCGWLSAELQRIAGRVTELPDAPMDSELLDGLAWRILGV